MTGLAVVVRTCQATVVAGAVALTLATAQAHDMHAPADPAPSPQAHVVEPSGAIGDPLVSRKHHHHKPASTSRPPREPRLTMPPTDTAP